MCGVNGKGVGGSGFPRGGVGREPGCEVSESQGWG